MKVRFEAPSNGWLPLNIRAADMELDFVASHTPEDFLLQLAEALLGVVNNNGTYVATLNEEPVETDIRFLRDEASVEMTIEQFPGGRQRTGRAEKLLRVSGETLGIVRPFWRALRSLEGPGGHNEKQFKQHWKFGFPKHEVAALTRKVKEAKRHAA